MNICALRGSNVEMWGEEARGTITESENHKQTEPPQIIADPIKDQRAEVDARRPAWSAVLDRVFAGRDPEENPNPKVRPTWSPDDRPVKIGVTANALDGGEAQPRDSAGSSLLQTTFNGFVASVLPPLTLAEEREARGLTLRGMADVTELSITTINSLEQGRIPKGLRRSTREALGEALRIDQTQLTLMLAATKDAAFRRQCQEKQYSEESVGISADQAQIGELTLKACRAHQVPTEEERRSRAVRLSTGKLPIDKIISRIPKQGVDRGTFQVIERRHQDAIRGHKTRHNSSTGLTQGEAAVRCGLSLIAYRRLESGQVVAREATVRKLSEGMGIAYGLMRRVIWESRKYAAILRVKAAQSRHVTKQE